jgi:hypothetical protein
VHIHCLLWRRGGNEWIQHRCIQAILSGHLPLPDNRSFTATPEAYANELLLWLLVSDLPYSLTTADASRRKESPMKTEISLLAGLLVLAIYAGSLIMLLVYIVHSFWLVTPQPDPFLVFSAS